MTEDDCRRRRRCSHNVRAEAFANDQVSNFFCWMPSGVGACGLLPHVMFGVCPVAYSFKQLMWHLGEALLGGTEIVDHIPGEPDARSEL